MLVQILPFKENRKVSLLKRKKTGFENRVNMALLA